MREWLNRAVSKTVEASRLPWVRIPPSPPVNPMKWVSVESSVFEAAAYLPSDRLLYLMFRSDDIYRYFDLPPEQYEGFLTADSKGRYFADNIRDTYRYEQVHGLTAAAT